MDGRTLTCLDLIDEGLVESPCCDSCHDDYDLGYELLDGYLADGRYCYVCCRVLHALEEKGLLRCRTSS